MNSSASPTWMLRSARKVVSRWPAMPDVARLTGKRRVLDVARPAAQRPVVTAFEDDGGQLDRRRLEPSQHRAGRAAPAASTALASPLSPGRTVCVTVSGGCGSGAVWWNRASTRIAAHQTARHDADGDQPAFDPAQHRVCLVMAVRLVPPRNSPGACGRSASAPTRIDLDSDRGDRRRRAPAARSRWCSRRGSRARCARTPSAARRASAGRKRSPPVVCASDFSTPGFLSMSSWSKMPMV